MKPHDLAKGDRVIWQYVETGIPVISHVLRVGFQGIWVRFGDTTCYIQPDMILAHRAASTTKRRKRTAKVRAIR